MQKVRSSTFDPNLNSGLNISAGILSVANPAQLATSSKSDLTGGFKVINGPAFSEPNSIPFSAAVIINCELGDTAEIGTLTANISSLTLNNFAAGQIVQILFKQDVTGGKTVTLTAGYKISGGLSTVANSYSLLSLYKPKDPTFAVIGSWSTYPA